MSEPQQQLLTLREVAELCKVHPNTIYRAVWDGELRAIKIRSRWRFDPADVERWFESAAA